MSARAYYSPEDRCWYVPVSGELLVDAVPAEPTRVELRDGELLITRLPDQPLFDASAMMEVKHGATYLFRGSDLTPEALERLRTEWRNRAPMTSRLIVVAGDVRIEERTPGLVGRLLCRLGVHDENRSQGVVGFCGRGCGDLRRGSTSGGGGWTRYVQPPGDGSPPPGGLPPVPGSLPKLPQEAFNLERPRRAGRGGAR